MKKFIREFFSILGVAFILAFVLRSFVIEGRIIPSGSMLPTIQLQDRVMVNKFIYRFTDPERGDIIVFDPPITSDLDYIKRVIGLPGEVIEIRDHKVWVNGESLNEPYLQEEIDYEFGPVEVPTGSYLVLGDNRNHSYDSHLWTVWMDAQEIKGKAVAIYWPISHITWLERGVTVEHENIAY